MRHSATIAVALSLTLLLVAGALGAEPDLSSPKSAAKSLFTAIAAGDAAAVRAAMYQGSAQQAELTSAMAELIVAGKKLGDAAHTKFGAAGDAIGRGMLDPADLDRLDQATVEESGDRAKLTVPGQPRPMSFRRQDNQWRLVISDMTDSAPEAIAKQTLLVHRMAEAMKTSAAEISSNAYKTPESAISAIQQRLNNVMLTFNRPSTTRSTTNPTTAPTTTR